MGERTEIYEREKLYEEVWKEPVLVVANRYGVSNVALAAEPKQCTIIPADNGPCRKKG